MLGLFFIQQLGLDGPKDPGSYIHSEKDRFPAKKLFSIHLEWNFKQWKNHLHTFRLVFITIRL